MNPEFPPLFSGRATSDPYEAAQAEAIKGCDAGLVCYDLRVNALHAAMVFAPEIALEDAVTMLPLCAVGFQNALGALGPPELAVHLGWDGGIWINGARCGGLRVAASKRDPAAEPDWLVIGLDLSLWPANDDPGKTPDETALYAEGCADVDAVRLLEAWVKHTLVGLNRWNDEGAGALHREFTGLAYGMGEPVGMQGRTGMFIGLDERLGMLVQDDTKTELIPLTDLLETQTP